MSNGTPPAEVAIDAGLIRDLLRHQHADLAELSLQLLDVGWDNVMYRLGEDYVVRLPRRQLAVALIQHEQEWLARFEDRLPIPIPRPVRIGGPNDAYPWPWSIVPWIPGETADLSPPDAGQAGPLSSFLKVLHTPAPPNAPKNPYRGVPLRLRAAKVEDRMARLRTKTELITPAVQRAWDAALEAADSNEFLWLHGDLHARNVLVDRGVITGIIDWGDLTAGDVASDLSTAWMLFSDPEARTRFWEGYQADSDLMARAKGWAVFYGLTLLDTGLVDHPRHAAMGETILRRIDA